MSRKVKLHAPVGTDEANYGTERYRVDNSGEVEVPEEAVESLVSVGGFEVVDQPVFVPQGLVHMRHPDPAASCGQAEKQADGTFFVPAAISAELQSHGFELVGDGEVTVQAQPVPAADAAAEVNQDRQA